MLSEPVSLPEQIWWTDLNEIYAVIFIKEKGAQNIL